MDVKSTWISTWHRMDYVSRSVGLFSKTISWRQAYHKTKRPWHSKHSQPLIYFILFCVRTRMNRNSLKLHLVEGPVPFDFTIHLRICNHPTWFWRCVGTAFRHFHLGSHNFMVTALGSCVKWP